MNAILQFVAAHWPLLSVGSVGAAALVFINRGQLTALVSKPKPRSIPAKNIDDLATEMLTEACKLPPVERDETNKLIDQIKKITERSLIEPLEDLSVDTAARMIT